jgi:hypothetical protein
MNVNRTYPWSGRRPGTDAVRCVFLFWSSINDRTLSPLGIRDLPP